MPQAEAYLQEKFLKDGSDGIAECEKLITDAGGSISKGWHISFPINIGDIPRNVWEACLFLCHEWDYAYDFREGDK
jgi:hypothetical protein